MIAITTSNSMSVKPSLRQRPSQIDRLTFMAGFIQRGSIPRGIKRALR
jgi:hypothetical protein